MNTIYIKGKAIRLNSLTLKGSGGEAYVYELNSDQLVKVFRPPDDPLFKSAPDPKRARDGAKRNIEIQQRKLREFPKNLPAHVITPIDLATDSTASLTVGYTMRFIRNGRLLAAFADPSFNRGGMFNNQIIKPLRDLHQVVQGLHLRQVVIGDFNPFNVLVEDDQSWLIDADSMQFGPYKCYMFTARFVDPLLCQWKQTTKLTLTKQHSPASDWYAYNVMVMNSLLGVDPYGGIYRPKNLQDKVVEDMRPLKRITVFNSDVRYPKPAVPYSYLPDELLHHFHEVFEKDARQPFPFPMLENLRWTQCSVCGVFHGRNICPHCAAVAPAAIKQTTVARGNVLATRLFRTTGSIVQATSDNGSLLWLYHEAGTFKREDGSLVFHGELNPDLRFGLRKDSTIVGLRNQVAILGPNAVKQNLEADAFAHNSRHYYWSQGGKLWRNAEFGNQLIGSVVSGHTRFWVGPKFGFGLYTAGNLIVGFVFDAQHSGLNDTVKLPDFHGHIVDATCQFAGNQAWFFLATERKGQITNHCLVIDRSGEVTAAGVARSRDGTWLSTIRGKCAVRNFLLVATDEGISRVQPEQGQVVVTKHFPDVEPFVTAATQLYAGKNGLYAVDRQEIKLITIS